jgi:hypothetical protein
MTETSRQTLARFMLDHAHPMRDVYPDQAKRYATQGQYFCGDPILHGGDDAAFLPILSSTEDSTRHAGTVEGWMRSAKRLLGDGVEYVYRGIDYDQLYDALGEQRYVGEIQSIVLKNLESDTQEDEIGKAVRAMGLEVPYVGKGNVFRLNRKRLEEIARGDQPTRGAVLE